MGQLNYLRGGEYLANAKHYFNTAIKVCSNYDDLKRPQVIETKAFPRIFYAWITAKMQVKNRFVQYLNINELFLN